MATICISSHRARKTSSFLSRPPSLSTSPSLGPLAGVIGPPRARLALQDRSICGPRRPHRSSIPLPPSPLLSSRGLAIPQRLPTSSLLRSHKANGRRPSRCFPGSGPWQGDPCYLKPKARPRGHPRWRRARIGVVIVWHEAATCSLQAPEGVQACRSRWRWNSRGRRRRRAVPFRIRHPPAAMQNILAVLPIHCTKRKPVNGPLRQMRQPQS